MLPSMTAFLLVVGFTILALLPVAGLLHVFGRLGRPGRWVAEQLARAPALDLVVAYFTVAPMIAGPIYAGWAGLAGAIVGQVIALLLWTAAHEYAHPIERRGPRILKVINAHVGPVRNYAAVYWTGVVVPLFSVVRLAEVLVYPPLTWLVRFPRYKQGDWVNVSRHKFSGLVGHDLVWCLYCDWMTGVWSLGTEMLRNVESFWCPIRFSNDKKCANCRTDFPDVDSGWVPADGSMEQVTATLQRMYPTPGTSPNAWYGHPVRLTVKGQPQDDGPKTV
jgi:hypothetical protein